MVDVNQPASTVVVDYSRLVTARPPLQQHAPIDAYYARAKELLRMSSEAWCSAQLLGLLAVDLVGSVELYVRSILVGMVATCPVAKQLCARKQVPIAAVTYYPPAELTFAVLDHVPLSDSKAISNATNNLLEFATKEDSSLDAALTAFDQVCHLRHALSHQTGRLGPHNLMELGIQATQPTVVALDAIRFQELVALCHTLVRALNQFLFERTIERWAAHGVFSLTWANDEAAFRTLCALLVSTEDVPAFDVAAAYQKLGGILSAVQQSAKKRKK